ncbi:transient receptor potential cation channel subfamily M member 1-like isoform X1 [Mytilus californianus]|uniref:transient receptor potential cation channel subfamily M member 1-like isoform X1 n=1 Tax=Mytilus californianus TaxID=6549 RepID=UPI0022459B0D|nr:transient receptor potential cation channel subfamily M member 1-like isoform X1 [Mytilus californianus]
MDTETNFNSRSHIPIKNNVIIDRWLNHSSKQRDKKGKPEEKAQEIRKKYTFKYTRGSETQNNLKHGIIRFRSDDTEEQMKIPCMIAPDDIDCKVIYEEMLKWIPDKKAPKAVLSLTGGSENFLNNETIANRLKSGLLDLITTTSLWLITGAWNTEITTSVGEAIQEYRDKHENNDHILAFGFSSFGKIVKGYYQTCNGKDLEPNHSHFIMVDGSEERVLKMRTNLRSYLATRLQIPVILLIVEGGSKTFEIALESVNKNIPVLVIEGSGKAADFISKGYKLSEDKTSEGKSVFTEIFVPEMLQSAKNMTVTGKDDPSKFVDQLKHCLKEKREMIYVFSLDDTSETLDRHIQDMIFTIRNKDNKMDTEKKIRLVNKWNRPDIAENHIFNMQNRQDIAYLRESLKKKNSAVSELFKKSLVENRVEFVTLLLKYILAPECYQQFVTENLSSLYRECMDPEKESSCTAGQFLHEYLQSSKQSMWKRGYWKNDCSDSKYLDDINQAVIRLLGNRELKPIENKGRIFPFKALFIWAVLMNQREMAELFWKKDSDFICAALYASSLAKKLAESACSEENMELITSFAENSKYYETLAYNVMTELYCKDKSKARQLLVKKVERYGCATIFELTEHNNLMKFIGHTACQTKLNIIWKGQIATYTSHLKVIFGAFLPFLIQGMMIQGEKEKISTHETPHTRHALHSGKSLPNGIFYPSTKPGSEYLAEQHQSKRAENWNGIAFHQRIRNIYYFYNAPATKFIFNVLAYTAFLVVFCLFVLTDLHSMPEGGISNYEYVTWGWAASMMTEELRQALVMSKAPLRYVTWFNFWTVYEGIMFCLFMASVLLRLTLSEGDFSYARGMYALTLGLYIVNIMQFFLVSKTIGPKVIMLGKLIYDIIFFVLLFAVFVFSFGVFYHANMYPNNVYLDNGNMTKRNAYGLFKNIIYMPYWQLYGELNLDIYEGDKKEEKDGSGPEVSEINLVLLAIYMVLTQTILINFLIAMFSHTFNKFQENNELVWKFHRFSLVQEYYDRCLLVPPLIIINHIKRASFYILHKCCNSKTNQVNVFRIEIKGKEKKRLDLLEKDAVKSYSNSSIRLRRSRAKTISSDDGSLEDRYKHDAELSLQEQVEVVTADVGQIHNQLKEITQNIKDIKAFKQKILLVELPRGVRSGTHIPDEVTMFE